MRTVFCVEEGVLSPLFVGVDLDGRVLLFKQWQEVFCKVPAGRFSGNSTNAQEKNEGVQQHEFHQSDMLLQPWRCEVMSKAV